jgi:PTS system cellobiose-specific IIB component
VKKLLICCLFGETAGIIARKMQKIADDRQLDLLISAVGVENFFSVAPAYDGVFFSGVSWTRARALWGLII